ncbi:MAG: TIGR04282 family arsenosugar biosynthesis glycosyltransferase [Nitrospirota bacterium]
MALSRCIILFVKYPEKGKVKTRFSARLGDETTQNLYRCFVSDLIEILEKKRYTFKIAFYPPDSEEKIISWLGPEHSYTTQVGKDLGERMENAFKDAFMEGFNEVLVIGSDIPDITPSLIDKAFETLKSSDAVIGPCFDGGYYLIGFTMKTFLPDIFKNIQWSTEGVFKDTMEVFSKKGYKVYVLPKLRDLDRIEDLRAFYKESKKTRCKYSKTLFYLSSIEDVLGYED